MDNEKIFKALVLNHFCKHETFKEDCPGGDCNECIREWLKGEADD